MKKYKSLGIAFLASAFFAITPSYAAEFNLAELGEKLNEEVSSKTDYVYIIGEYIFTSSHELTTQDTMLAARTISVDEEDGETDEDPIYGKMAIQQLERDYDDDFNPTGRWNIIDNLLGETQINEQQNLNISFIDYKEIKKSAANVSNEQQLLDALADEDVEIIVLTDGFTVEKSVLINRDVIINGNGKTITMSEKNSEYKENGDNYIFKIYGTDVENNSMAGSIVMFAEEVSDIIEGTESSDEDETEEQEGTINVTLNDMKLTGANGAVLVGGGAKVTATKIDTTGNNWGGYEVANGILIGSELTQSDEAFNKPIAWVEDSNKEKSTINIGAHKIDNKAKNQQYYYLAENINPTWVGSKQDLETALSGENAEVVVISGAIDVDNLVIATNDVTILGDKDASITGTVKVTGNNVTIDNLTINGDGKGNLVEGTSGRYKNGKYYIIEVTGANFALTNSTIGVKEGTQEIAYNAINFTNEAKATITGNTFNLSNKLYNTIEFSWTGAVLDGTVISNNEFKGTAKNNNINIYNVSNEATVTIEGNHFDKSANALRLSSVNDNNSGTIIIKDNDYSETVEGDYAGFMFFQKDSGNKGDIENYTIKVTNLIGPSSEKITTLDKLGYYYDGTTKRFSNADESGKKNVSSYITITDSVDVPEAGEENTTPEENEEPEVEENPVEDGE